MTQSREQGAIARTTIALPDDLHRVLSHVAVDDKRSIKSIIIDASRLYIYIRDRNIPIETVDALVRNMRGDST